MAESRRERLVGDPWRYAISALGVLLLVVGVGTVLLDGQLTRQELVQVSSLVVLSVLLVGVGARVALVVSERTQLFSILGWTAIGVLALGALGGWYQLVLGTVDSPFDTALLFLSVLAAGALFGAVVGYYDVRVRRLVERASREEARREFADEQRETLSSLNGILRHQILNDLSAISGRAELLGAGKVDADDAAASILDHCDHVEDTVTRIETVVDALTHGSGRTLTPLEDVIGQAVTRVHKHHPELRIDTDGVPAVSVPVDGLLHVAVAELLENTAVHTDEAAVTVSARETGNSVIIELADDGPGVDVPPEKLFEPNTRGPDSDGDGLGLFLADLIVGRYDGTIRLTEGETGATFEVDIPTDVPVEDAEPPP